MHSATSSLEELKAVCTSLDLCGSTTLDRGVALDPTTVDAKLPHRAEGNSTK
jgi:hypothetical protein